MRAEKRYKITIWVNDVTDGQKPFQDSKSTNFHFSLVGGTNTGFVMRNIQRAVRGYLDSLKHVGMHKKTTTKVYQLEDCDVEDFLKKYNKEEDEDLFDVDWWD